MVIAAQMDQADVRIADQPLLDEPCVGGHGDGCEISQPRNEMSTCGGIVQHHRISGMHVRESRGRDSVLQAVVLAQTEF